VTEHQPGRSRSFDREEWGSLDAEQARFLRRRIRFWRNVALMLVLGIALGVVVYFVRRSTIADRCRMSLTHYGKLAEALKLNDANIATIELRWRYLDPARDGLPPTHYQLIPDNWSQTPSGADEFPLAVCAEPHGTLIAGGRNVLFRSATGWRVKWVPEDVGAALAEQGAKAEKSLLMVR
jgi:hypothetical protein